MHEIAVQGITGGLRFVDTIILRNTKVRGKIAQSAGNLLRQSYTSITGLMNTTSRSWRTHLLIYRPNALPAGPSFLSDTTAIPRKVINTIVKNAHIKRWRNYTLRKNIKPYRLPPDFSFVRCQRLTPILLLMKPITCPSVSLVSTNSSVGTSEIYSLALSSNQTFNV